MNVTIRQSIAALSAASLLLTGCGDNQDRPAVEDRPAAEETSTNEQSADAETQEAGENGRIEITVDDTMQFSVDRIEVNAGEEVTVVLRHTGQMAKETMGHNFVLLEQGSDVNAFATASVQARDTDYIPEDLSDQVIAHTDLIGGGEESEITFTAPDEPGEYTYICSFPGHALAGMTGVLVVQ